MDSTAHPIGCTADAGLFSRQGKSRDAPSKGMELEGPGVNEGSEKAEEGAGPRRI